MSEADAYRAFRRVRWPDSNGMVPWCPRCGAEGAYELASRNGRSFSNRLRCKQSECRHDFSVTSGTIFQNRKLPFRTMLQAVALSVQSSKGKAALQLSRELCVQYKTAWVLSHKLREAVAAERAAMTLSGTVEMDGLYIGGTPRLANRREDRIDNRRGHNPKKQCVMALRQRGGRILATVVPGELRAPAWDLVRQHVRAPGELVADEAGGYDDLVALFPMKRNNHGEAYVVEPGASTNQAESFFSRLRRSAHGVHHRVAGTYLDWYVADLAVREDMRRVPTKDRLPQYLASALAHPPSRNIAGYWQGVKPPRTLGWRPPEDGGDHPMPGGSPSPRPPRPPRPRDRRDDDDDPYAPQVSGRAIKDAVAAAKRKLAG